MKFEIDDNQLIDKIANKVIQQLSPLLKHNTNCNDNELMTVDDVAAYLKAKKSTIYDKVHNRIIPFLKNGSSLRFRKKHIDLWLLNPYHHDLNIYNLNRERR
jgi:excisionase family DNA binding protein